MLWAMALVIRYLIYKIYWISGSIGPRANPTHELYVIWYIGFGIENKDGPGAQMGPRPNGPGDQVDPGPKWTQGTGPGPKCIYQSLLSACSPYSYQHVPSLPSVYIPGSDKVTEFIPSLLSAYAPHSYHLSAYSPHLHQLR